MTYLTMRLSRSPQKNSSRRQRSLPPSQNHSQSQRKYKYPKSQLPSSQFHVGRLRSGAVENEAGDDGAGAKEDAVDGSPSRNGQKALRAKRLQSMHLPPKRARRLLRSPRSPLNLKNRLLRSKRVMVRIRLRMVLMPSESLLFVAIGAPQVV
jgi:hypothetical protein